MNAGTLYAGADYHPVLDEEGSSRVVGGNDGKSKRESTSHRSMSGRSTLGLYIFESTKVQWGKIRTSTS